MANHYQELTGLARLSSNGTLCAELPSGGCEMEEGEKEIKILKLKRGGWENGAKL
jgi:hypothetical protein